MRCGTFMYMCGWLACNCTSLHLAFSDYCALQVCCPVNRQCALKYIIEFGYTAQRLSVYIVTSQLSIPYSFQTTDMQSTVVNSQITHTI